MDTEIYMSLESYLEVLRNQGFKEVLKASFVGRHWRNLKWNPNEDHYFIYWREPVLVAFDSHEGRLVNGGYVYCNWLPHQKQEKYYVESGYWINDNLLAVKYDCRVDFIRKLDILGNTGTLISPWAEHKKLWLVNYIERYESEDHDLVTRNRLSQLPEEVRNCIGRWHGEEKKEEKGDLPQGGPSDSEIANQAGRCGC